MSKSSKGASTPENAYQNVLDALSASTGLNWSPPPSTPSRLKNGYFVETEMVHAPRLVRQLKDIAVVATGRPRAIVFERSSPKNASVNIPKEIAEDQQFIDALSGKKIQAQEAAKETPVSTRPLPKTGLMQIKKPSAMPEVPGPILASNSLPHLQTGL